MKGNKMISDINDRLSLIFIKIAKMLTSDSLVYKNLKDAEDYQKWHIEALNR